MVNIKNRNSTSIHLWPHFLLSLPSYLPIINHRHHSNRVMRLPGLFTTPTTHGNRVYVCGCKADGHCERRTQPMVGDFEGKINRELMWSVAGDHVHYVAWLGSWAWCHSHLWLQAKLHRPFTPSNFLVRHNEWLIPACTFVPKMYKISMWRIF